MNVCIISGSARENNNTIRVGKAIQKLLNTDNVTIVDFRQYDIPLILQGHINPNELTPFQQHLYETMLHADLIYLISPEYNWSTTPEILNWLHRFGNRQFQQLFDNKVFALIGVSTGKGGKAPVLHLTGVLHKIIGFFNLQSVVSPKLFESHYTKEMLDEEGNLQGDMEYEAGFKNFIAYTGSMTERWAK